MRRSSCCVFDTRIGWCGIAWTDGGNPAVVTHFQLPEDTLELTESRIARSSGAREATTPQAEIGQVIKQVCRHLEGDVQDFRDVVLGVTEENGFPQEVYEAARLIPAGETRTYGGLTKILGRPGSSQAVGQALVRNPIPLLIPCHRVATGGGRLARFSAYGGLAIKARLLAIEGASLSDGQGQLFTQP